MAGKTHFPNGVEAGSYSINGVVQNNEEGKDHEGTTHFPNGITTPVLTVGGTVIAGSGSPATHFPNGVDLGAGVTIG
jgi:hypothetical protein